MTPEELTQLKQYYKEKPLNDAEVDLFWQELSGKLPQKQYHPYHFVARFAIIYFVISLFIGSAVYTVYTAKSESSFYPVRVLAERIIAQLTTQYDKLIEKRADDTVNSSQKYLEKTVEDATKDYQTTRDETASDKQEAKETSKESAERTEQKLKKIIPTDSKAQNLIHQSIKAVEQLQKEVKGAQAEEKKPDHAENDNKPNTPTKPETPSQENNRNGESKRR